MVFSDQIYEVEDRSYTTMYDKEKRRTLVVIADKKLGRSKKIFLKSRRTY